MFTPQQILAFTDVSLWQQQCILKLWNETGTVKKDNKLQLKGRPRHLRMEEASVSQSKHVSVVTTSFQVIICTSFFRVLPIQDVIYILMNYETP